ncbi:hypothetical protein LOS25_15885 [Enterococcus faecium]|nr:hypothetical protein [Enterococcus faecium]
MKNGTIKRMADLKSALRKKTRKNSSRFLMKRSDMRQLIFVSTTNKKVNEVFRGSR